jgi:hypothetical protein
MAYFYLPEDTAFSISFREVFSIHNLNVIKTITATFYKIAIFCFRARMFSHSLDTEQSHINC